MSFSKTAHSSTESQTSRSETDKSAMSRQFYVDTFQKLIEKIQNHENEKVRQLEFLLYMFIERKISYVNCNDLYDFDSDKLAKLFNSIVHPSAPLPPIVTIVLNGPTESPFKKFDIHIHISLTGETPGKIPLKNIGNPITHGNSSSSAAGSSSGFESNPVADRQARSRPVLLVKNVKTKLAEDPRESAKAKSDEPKESIYIRTKVSDEIKDLFVISFDEWFYNPMDHESQPTFRVLSDKTFVLKKYNVKESGIPKMDCILKDGEKKDSDKDYKGDIVGRFLGFRSGEIIEIQRKTQMNGTQTYYRIAK
jgi:DNA-directed RNA polymerase subunit H (RpoH/RPB5)